MNAVLTPVPDLRGAAAVSAQGGCISPEHGPAQHPAVHLLQAGICEVSASEQRWAAGAGGQMMDVV